jgi:hypothetical protein
MSAPSPSTSRLAVLRDGVELPEEQARALWRAFSEHMERNQDDLEGFARDHGFVSVRAEHRRGRAVLVVATSASIPPPVPGRESREPREERTSKTPARGRARVSVPAKKK